MLDLYELEREKKRESKWMNYKGIRYKVEYTKRGAIKSIIVVCPKCGKVGYLIRQFSTKRYCMRVFHKLPSREYVCHFSSCASPYFDILKELYYKIRCE